jgi:predicted amidohydrolase YtcJ
MYKCIVLAGCLVAALGLPTLGIAAEVDLILHHGKIVTVDKTFGIAEAMAVRGERIAAVGDNQAILKLAGANTRKVDLQGKTVLPGLIDSHVHPVGASVYEFDHPIPNMECVADVLAYISARAKVLKPGQWITVNQVFITRLRERRFPTRQELDRAAPQNPVAFRTGPDASLNSVALKLCGIDRSFRVTDGRAGFVEHDPATGEPTGIVRSCGRFIKGGSVGKSPTPDERRDRLRQMMQGYNEAGITGIVDRGAGDSQLALYQQLKDRGELTCRVFAYYGVDSQAPIAEVEARIAKAAKNPLHAYNNLLWMKGIKIFLDGGMLTGSAYMRQPWGVSKIYSITDPQYRGVLFVQPEPLYQIARSALAHDFQLSAHTVGDGAVHALLDAYERVNREFPVRAKRPCISHCNFMSAEAVATMKRLGVVADIQPVWLFLDGATLRAHFGDERLTWFQPLHTLFEQGVMVGGGSDHMQKIEVRRSINSYDPFLAMWTTISRQPRWTDRPLHLEQRLSRQEAIRFYTINNAYLTFEEKEKGSLERGKLADFILLDKDILTCPEEAIKNIQVTETWLGGKRVYCRK